MSMADQYEDGRYDGLAPEDEIDKLLNPDTWDGLCFEHGADCTDTRKEHPMGLTPKQKLTRYEAELDSNLTLQKKLREAEVKLRNEIRKADIPPQPDRAAGDWFRVIVQFHPRGLQYTYLLSRNANRWYTTGTSEEQKRFDSWSALCGWLNEAHWHSPLHVLAETGISFPTKREE